MFHRRRHAQSGWPAPCIHSQGQPRIRESTNRHVDQRNDCIRQAKGFLVGADLYLTKPFSGETISKAFASMVEIAEGAHE